MEGGGERGHRAERVAVDVDLVGRGHRQVVDARRGQHVAEVQDAADLLGLCRVDQQVVDVEVVVDGLSGQRAQVRQRGGLEQL